MNKKRFSMPKINTIHFGGRMILAGIIIGVIIPWLFSVIFNIFLWWLCVLGGAVLFSFIVIFCIEMKQDFGKVPYYEKHLTESIPFNKDKQYAVVRSSLCTREKIAGFKNISDSHFTEVMVINTPKDLERFKTIYGLTDIKTE